MTSKDFKKINHFRSTADRNCYNCKYCWHEPNLSINPYGNESQRRKYCANDSLSNGSHKFLITNFSICDSWDRRK